MLLRLVLEGDGRFQVVGEAEDGAQAIELAAERRPDVAVVDLAMPTMDGLEAIPSMRSASPDMRIVVLSAFAADTMRQEALAVGAHGYIEKGTPTEEVVSLIANLTGAQRVRTGAVPADEHVEPLRKQGPGIDEVLAHLNHEFRTPLTVVRGFAATVRAAVARGDTDTAVRSAEAIERNVGVLTDLLQSFADARDVDVGRLELDVEVVDLTEFVAEVVGDLQVLQSDHELRVDVPSEAVLASIDRVRIRQVLANLIGNAVKFGPKGSPVAVTLRLTGAVAETSVRDYGEGVPAARRGELFTKFVRLHEGVKGTGLGLYISRGIARAHGGDLEHVPPEDAGACFVLRLPLAR